MMVCKLNSLWAMWDEAAPVVAISFDTMYAHDYNDSRHTEQDSYAHACWLGSAVRCLNQDVNLRAKDIMGMSVAETIASEAVWCSN